MSSRFASKFMSAGLLISKLYSRLVWMSTKNPNTNVSDRQTVPFLPVSSDFSSTRNQGRQKLARFNAREFATLIMTLRGGSKGHSVLGCLNLVSVILHNSVSLLA